MMYSYTHRTQTGMSMIDVMLAIFIFSVGLLGIAGLQALSKTANYEAVQRTTAVMLANDIVERMRSNPDSIYATPSLYYRRFEPLATNGPAQPGTSCSFDPDTGTRPNCSPAELAAHDLWEWSQAIQGATDQLASTGANSGGLVQPSACITDPTPAVPDNDDVRVAIVWRGKTAMSDSNAPTTCGQGTGEYGPGDVNRRVFFLTTHINPDV